MSKRNVSKIFAADLNWSSVFDTNQLMFQIWEYFAFPRLLKYCAVAKSWKRRLWDTQLFTPEEWQSVKRIKYCIASFQPASITSSSCSFGKFVKQARFGDMPTVSPQSDAVISQLFTFYPFIEQIQFDELSRNMNQIFDQWRRARSKFYEVDAKDPPLISLVYNQCNLYGAVLPELATHVIILEIQTMYRPVFTSDITSLSRNLRKLTLRYEAYRMDSFVCDFETLLACSNLKSVDIEARFIVGPSGRGVVSVGTRIENLKRFQLRLIHTGSIALFPIQIERLITVDVLDMLVSDNWLFIHKDIFKLNAFQAQNILNNNDGRDLKFIPYP